MFKANYRQLISCMILCTCLFQLSSCNQQRRQNKDDEISEICQETASETAEAGTRETLNDIRFDGWTKKEWADNEYIREVRRYIDAYNNGEFEDPDLDEYKEYIQGKFVIGDINPGLWGGAFMYIMFYDHPDMTFSVLVYSDVDEETRTVSNYKCYGLKYEDMDLGYSQEDILQFLKECPEHRMW